MCVKVILEERKIESLVILLTQIHLKCTIQTSLVWYLVNVYSMLAITHFSIIILSQNNSAVTVLVLQNSPYDIRVTCSNHNDFTDQVKSNTKQLITPQECIKSAPNTSAYRCQNCKTQHCPGSLIMQNFILATYYWYYLL